MSTKVVVVVVNCGRMATLWVGWGELGEGGDANCGHLELKDSDLLITCSN